VQEFIGVIAMVRFGAGWTLSSLVSFPQVRAALSLLRLRSFRKRGPTHRPAAIRAYPSTSCDSP